MIRSSAKTKASNSLIRECDALVWAIVQKRNGARCVRCGGTTALTPFHILPKGKYPKLRFDMLNVLCICWPCHKHHWHDDPVGGVEWLERKLPGRIEMLRVMDATARKPDLKELRIALREDLLYWSTSTA